MTKTHSKRAFASFFATENLSIVSHGCFCIFSQLHIYNILILFVLRIFFLQLASLWLPYPFVGGVVIYSHFPIEPRCWISLVEI